MTLMFPLLLLIAGLLTIPAYLYSRRRHPESRWLPVAAVPAVAAWLLLAGSGYGAQSLSNLIEVLWLLVASVILAYAKVLAVDRVIGFRAGGTYILMGMLLIAALLLRSFMPVLPE